MTRVSRHLFHVAIIIISRSKHIPIDLGFGERTPLGNDNTPPDFRGLASAAVGHGCPPVALRSASGFGAAELETQCSGKREHSGGRHAIPY